MEQNMENYIQAGDVRRPYMSYSPNSPHNLMDMVYILRIILGTIQEGPPCPLLRVPQQQGLISTIAHTSYSVNS